MIAPLGYVQAYQREWASGIATVRQTENSRGLETVSDMSDMKANSAMTCLTYATCCCNQIRGASRDKVELQRWTDVENPGFTRNETTARRQTATS